MFARSTIPCLSLALFELFAVRFVAAQNATPAAQPPGTAQSAPSVSTRKAVAFDDFVDSAIRQERRMTDLLRNFKPVVETYIQKQQPDAALGTSPKNDEYFLSRLDLAGNAASTSAFADDENLKRGVGRILHKIEEPFAAAGFAQALFPDLDHFDRQNYSFEFVRWEILGELRCAAVDVKPRENSGNHRFVGRIWVEDQDFNLVRFTGTYTSKAFSKHAFHFDSWRLNTLGTMWMPAYVYTEESDPKDSSSHGLWFKAQTRIWGYDMAHAGDHREYAKPLTDTPVWIDPKRHEASQDLSPAYTLGQSTYTPDDNVVERLQVAGLMAPDGEVNRILQTVVNNLMVTNDLDLAGVRCRVLLTTPLESFVMGRTIVLSRGLLDVLPDEGTLAAVLAHELAHIVLGHSVEAGYLSGLTLPFSDLEIFAHLNFHFDPAQETDADKKGLELFSKSPYKDQLANAGLFLKALEARSPQLPNLLHGRFSNDFGSSHLIGMQALAHSAKPLQMDRVDQISALPLGSRVAVDPWSDRIEMLKSKPVRLESASEKMPFEVSPFFPHLKRRDEPQKGQARTQP
ncbi:MAG: peptidase Ste24p [Candidatus Sulfotelmatobacter sp.]|nr:peptidase Ste24p [Candidatus Sulfotelmatobacter sp.]